jgi:hypothetical protein
MSKRGPRTRTGENLPEEEVEQLDLEALLQKACGTEQVDRARFRFRNQFADLMLVTKPDSLAAPTLEQLAQQAAPTGKSRGLGHPRAHKQDRLPRGGALDQKVGQHMFDSNPYGWHRPVHGHLRTISPNF